MKFTLFALATVFALTEARQGRMLKAEQHPGRELRSSRRNRNDRGSRGQERDSDETDRVPGHSDTERFASWAAESGKHFKNNREFELRLSAWKATDEEIQETNGKAKSKNDLRLKHNQFSDMTQLEKSKYLGLKIKEADLEQRLEEDRKQQERNGRERVRGGRHLAHTASVVDWHADGYTGDVKDQGACGSCYTFASNTALEATLMIEQGAPYQRLSEQQIVDCANWDVTQYFYLYGCQGGYMSEVWWYQRDNGAMLDEEYPYVSGTTSSVGQCQYDQSKTKNVVTSWGSVTGGKEAIIEAVQVKPMAVAVSAGNTAFMQYSSGILTSSDCNGGLDHAVVLVGYHDGSENNDDDDDSHDDGGDDGGDDGSDTITETECRRQRWKDMFYETGCRYSDETLVDTKYCCWTNTYIVDDDDTTVQSGGRGDPTGTPFYKIQNSWGTWWGDDGFVYLAVEDGNGACGVNQWVDIVSTI